MSGGGRLTPGAAQRWIKIGRIPITVDDPSWKDDYAAVPFIEWVDRDRCWLYFSARDRLDRSHTRRALIDLREPLRPVVPEEGHVVGPTSPGFFDADGAMGSDLVTVGRQRRLYYIGWNRGADVPFRNAIGVAVADRPGSPFRRHGDGPILDRSSDDPCFVASNCVVPDGDGYRMWYLSCIEWTLDADGSWRHRYHIKDAVSSDGYDWRPTGNVAVDFASDAEYAISVPRVHRREGGWEMWYSNRAGPRSESYRIGYATSSDGDRWTRHDGWVDLDVSDAGWDSEMVCYPYVFDHGGRRYLLYNGNGYGRTGVGLAYLDL